MLQKAEPESTHGEVCVDACVHRCVDFMRRRMRSLIFEQFNDLEHRSDDGTACNEISVKNQMIMNQNFGIIRKD